MAAAVRGDLGEEARGRGGPSSAFQGSVARRAGLVERSPAAALTERWRRGPTGAVDPLLDDALRAALLQELLAEWKLTNREYFGGALRPPQLALTEGGATLGRWVSRSRTLEISLQLALSQPWGVVVEVLRHEMAHQLVDEALGIHDEAAHGATFRKVCERHGFDGRARGMPAAEAPEEERLVDRVRKLLALAESPNPNEAAAALAAAQRLMAKHNIDLAARNAKAGYTVRFLGEPTGRVREPARLLGGILTQYFFVEGIWTSAYRPREGRRGSVFEISGTVSNVDLAEYVHGFVTGATERLWAAHKRAQGIRSDRDRIAFQSGVMTGFAEKLRAEQATQRGEGLIVARDAGLSAFYRARHPRIRSVRYGGESRGETFAHGRAEGRRLDVGRPLRPGDGPKLLPGRSR